jgi:flagellar assembly factor FliW
MLHSSIHTIGALAGVVMMETIQSRFGEITVDTDKAILFPRGLLGMPDRFRFALANFPNPKMQQFTLLQSLDDHALSFISLPLEINNGIVAAADLQAACRDLKIEEPNLVILLIVSVHRGPDRTKLSVNARAPLLIDATRKAGVQYVFQQDHYKVQHML